MRILNFMCKYPEEELIQSQIERGIGGEEWGRLSAFLQELQKLGSVEIIDKKQTLGHMVYKITPKGRDTIAKYMDPAYKIIKEHLGIADENDES
jgi:DNA-binding HxlR family transcriptional regulator